jgi:hypothetical protein
MEWGVMQQQGFSREVVCGKPKRKKEKKKKIKPRSKHLGLLGVGTMPLEENSNQNVINQIKLTNGWGFLSMVFRLHQI